MCTDSVTSSSYGLQRNNGLVLILLYTMIYHLPIINYNIIPTLLSSTVCKWHSQNGSAQKVKSNSDDTSANVLSTFSFSFPFFCYVNAMINITIIIICVPNYKSLVMLFHLFPFLVIITCVKIITFLKLTVRGVALKRDINLKEKKKQTKFKKYFSLIRI